MQHGHEPVQILIQYKSSFQAHITRYGAPKTIIARSPHQDNTELNAHYQKKKKNQKQN